MVPCDPLLIFSYKFNYTVPTRLVHFILFYLILNKLDKLSFQNPGASGLQLFLNISSINGTAGCKWALPYNFENVFIVVGLGDLIQQ